MSFRITEIWAFTSIDPKDDEEGIIGLRTPEGWVPMVAADKTRLLQLRHKAEEVAAITGRPVHLTRFSVREDVEVLQPGEKPSAPPATTKQGARCNPVETWAVQHERRCPDCGSTLADGPRGGLSQNVLCSGCGSRFNDTLAFGVDRISDAGAGTGRRTS
jgi:hypothetical protein